MFEVVKKNPTADILKQGISKITKSVPQGPDFPNTRIAAQVISDEIVKLLFDENELIKEIAAGMVLSWLRYTYKEKKYEYIDHVYAFALRAWQFKKSDKRAPEYSSITKADCDNAVRNSEIFQEDVKKHPFDEEQIYEQAAARILKHKIIPSGYSDFEWKHWAIKNIKFIDAACYFAWIALDESDETLTDAVNTLHTYVVNNVD